jgi:hypothetical protein
MPGINDRFIRKFGLYSTPVLHSLHGGANSASIPGTHQVPDRRSDHLPLLPRSVKTRWKGSSVNHSISFSVHPSTRLKLLPLSPFAAFPFFCVVVLLKAIRHSRNIYRLFIDTRRNSRNNLQRCAEGIGIQGSGCRRSV